MKSIAIGVLLLISCVCLTRSADAQQASALSSSGRDFYLAELMPSIKCSAIKPFQGFFALISTAYDCNVTISYFDGNQGGKEIQGATVHVAAKRSAQIALDQSLLYPTDANGFPLNPDGEVPMYTACHIHADRPISVSYYSTGPNSGTEYLVLPTQVLGTQYVVASLPADPAVGAANSHHFACTVDSGSSVFSLIAVTDNTSVTIRPSGLTRGGHDRQHPISITLHRGQVYWVKSVQYDATDDLSGSIVTSDKPVAVIAGNEDALNGMSIFAGNGGDQRNVFAQEMLPVRYWRSSDYLSMPFMDNPDLQPGDLSSGDLYRVFTFDPTGTTGTLSSGGGSTSLVIPRFSFASVDNVVAGANVASSNGTQIMVQQYDYRAQSSTEPFTAPTMMNVVPLKNFGIAFMFSVGDEKAQVHKRRYINVIALTSQFPNIKVQYNGGSPASVTALTAAGNTTSIPGHPELQGRRYEIVPGAYFMYADSAFIVYQYGMLGLDPDFDLGDNDDDDYYFEYASPAGETFGNDAALSPTVKVDTTCNGWHITASDSNAIDGGIALVEILKDTFGILLRKPGTSGGYTSTNADFNPYNFTVIPGTTALQTDIVVDDPLKAANVWLWVVNGGGGSRLLNLVYAPQKLSLTPATILDTNLAIGVDSCTHIVFHNLSSTDGRSYNVGAIYLAGGNQGFSVSNVRPTLPVALKPGDSLTFTVCSSFDKPATVYKDTVLLQTDCPTFRIPLVGSTNVGEINAEDYDFGQVLVGNTSCHNIRVSNTGKAAFTLTKKWILDNFSNFAFADSALLPRVLAPGQTAVFRFCFSPQNSGLDTAIMQWASDLPDPYTHLTKDYSVLSGRGIKPSITWRPLTQYFFGSDSCVTNRVTLNNDGTASIVIDTVKLLNGTHFTITGNQNDYIGNHQYALDAGSSIWYDVKFCHDLNDHSVYIDTLLALDNEGLHPFAILVGNASGGVPTSNSSILNFTIQQTAEGKAFAIVPQELVGRSDVVLFDLLGRNVNEMRVTSMEMPLEVSGLAPGTYYARLSDGSSAKTVRFQIVR